jgi:hypothetical protein
VNLNNLSEESVEFILKGLEILTKTGEFDMEDVLKIAALHQLIDKTATEILNQTNNEEIPETLARSPNKDERFVYGKAEFVKK